jgi:uncharacterized SAM-binding protein YcdF (DUF218 family)
MPALPSKRLWGLVTRRERWGLSWRGWLIAGLVILGTGWILVLGAHPFLAVTDRVDARFLVVEGWVPAYAIHAGIEEFKSGRYERVFTTGGMMQAGRGDDGTNPETAATWGANRLRRGGVGRELIQEVPSPEVSRDRTYSSAVALRNWFRDHGVSVQAINVVTEDVHARRTRLLFQDAFGPKVSVGVIAPQNNEYDPKRWWCYSEGVREILGETIAYVYARFFFFPKD